MDKNTIIAIVAIFVLVLVFQMLFLRPRLEERAEQGVGEGIETEQETVEEEGTAQPEVEVAKPLPLPEEEAELRIVSVETAHYTMEISTAGASIISLQLKDYLDNNGMPVELIDFEADDKLPFEVQFDRLKNLPFGDRSPYYVETTEPNSYRFWRDFQDSKGNAFRFSKTYQFEDDEFMFDVRLAVMPLTDEGELYLNWDNISYTMLLGPVLGPVSVLRNRYNITTQGFHENGKFHKILRGVGGGCTLRRGESKYEEFLRNVDWVGITNRYFFIGIVPENRNHTYSFDQRTQGKYFLGISGAYHRGRGFEDNFRVYAGPKDRRLLRQYGYNFDSVMSARVLKPIVIFLEWMINGFYNWTNSYGLAIIFMTIVIKIILYPLTRKSFKSMRRMSALQPRINKIKEQYKSNQAQMNREVQALYKKEKVSPMGGCLPLILQLPIFYALYTLLSGMIALRNESFLWIKDLSLPDTVATIKMAVPLLGYRVGGQGFTDINILPFVMTGSTLLQSKLSSGDQSAQQAKMMTYLFPLMFFFIFWNMPSGLVLYWTIQNVLTIGQQYLIDYRMKKKASTPEPEKKAHTPAKKKRPTSLPIRRRR
jgi:YidC/Oxa1 family membrane protein insertase